MDLGKTEKIIEVPIIIKIPKRKKKEEPIYVPNWPVKSPIKVPQEK